MKGVILAGGSGSRLSPLTRSMNKHLLPLGGAPMVTYAVEALVNAGIEDLILIAARADTARFAQLLGDGSSFGIRKLSFAYQSKPGGVAQAIGLAESFVAGDRCCVLLADNVFETSLKPLLQNFETQERGARVVLLPIDETERLRLHAVAELDKERIVRILEKPKVPPSPYLVAGFYLYDERVWERLPAVKPSPRGELEITDVNNWYAERSELAFDFVTGFWRDAGESLDSYRAVDHFLRQRSDFGH